MNTRTWQEIRITEMNREIKLKSYKGEFFVDEYISIMASKAKTYEEFKTNKEGS